MTTQLITLVSPLTCGGADAGVAAVQASQGTDSTKPIGGLIVPFNVDMHPSGPFATVRFSPGSIAAPGDVSHVKLLRDHDAGQPLGVMTAFDPHDSGIDGSFRMGRHASAVEASGMVADKILDGLSVSVQPIQFHDDHGTTVVTKAALREVSLVALPAASDARATVAATSKDTPMTGTPTPPAAPAAPTAPPVPAPAPDSAALNALIEQQIAAHLASLTAPPVPAPLPPATAPAPAPVSAQTSDGRIVAVDRPGQYPAARGRDGKSYTAGDYFVAFAAGHREGNWEPYREISAALADETTADIPGLLPQQIVGELLGSGAGRRPVWDSLSARPMPMIGNKFSRPMLTQHVKVDVQAAERDEVASQDYKVSLVDVPKTTIAGGLDVSQQAIDWSSPALLNQLISDFVRVYINRTDTYAAAALKTATTGTAVEWDGTAKTLPAALAKAANGVYGALGADDDSLPDTVWLSPDTWEILAGLTDDSGRSIFPFMTGSASNADATRDLSRPDLGLSNAGFRYVVSKRLAAKTFTMGDSSLIESYENGRRFLSATVPSVLGLSIAYMGYAACYAPYPKVFVPITVKPASGK